MTFAPSPHLALVFFVGALLAGCASPLDPYKPVAEFPSDSQSDYRSRGGTILYLYKWTPDTSAAAKAAMQAEHDNKVIETCSIVQRASIQDGQVAGFRRRGGSLFAIAGPNSIPLPPCHYTWQLVSQDPRGHHGADSMGDSSGVDLLDPLRDEVNRQDNNSNGLWRQDQTIRHPEMAK